MMDKMRIETADITALNIEKIGALFPNCITEMLDEEKSTEQNKVYKKAVNFELLKQMLSKKAIDSNEAYEFTWVGKKASIVEANKPIRKTLRPCKDESTNWDDTQNLYIEGDNLEVLKLLQESYLGKVKMIYIDPPYNTGNDFIYNDDFKMNRNEYANRSGEIDKDGNRMLKNTDSKGSFHSDWCSMIYPRLLLARNLLSDDGVIFISIDDNEQANLKKICDEVFGMQNFVANLIWQKKKGGSQDSQDFAKEHEYVLCYKKSEWQILDEIQEYSENDFSKIINGRKAKILKLEKWGAGALKTDAPTLYYPIKDPTNNDFYPVAPNGEAGRWRKKPENLDEKHISWQENSKGRLTPYEVIYFDEVDFKTIKTRTIFTEYGTTTDATKEILALFENKKLFDTPKPTSLIKKFLQVSTNSGDLDPKFEPDIILDFFSGSATTAHAVMAQNLEDGGNRKFIMVQLPEVTKEDSEAYKAGYKNICEIGKERIRRAGKKILEENKDKEGIENLDIGFRVLKLDETNMENVYYSPSEYNQDLLSTLESNVKPDRSDLDLLFGCLLEWGLPLSLPYSCDKIGECTVHNYNDGDLIACFDENIAESVIKEIAKKHPLRAVFRDSSFADSPSKINVAEIFKLLAPDTRVKVI
jgi:type III restriction-modification system, methylase subunit